MTFEKGDFSFLPNSKVLSDTYKVICKLDAWETMKSFTSIYSFQDNFREILWECEKNDIDVDDGSLYMLKDLAFFSWEDFVTKYNKECQKNLKP